MKISTRQKWISTLSLLVLMILLFASVSLVWAGPAAQTVPTAGPAGGVMLTPTPLPTSGGGGGAPGWVWGLGGGLLGLGAGGAYFALRGGAKKSAKKEE